MKKSLLGSLIGVSIILSIDSLSRVIIALYMKEDILMFSYSEYQGLLWPVLLTGIAAFSSFFGAMFALTYGREKPVLSLILFTVLAVFFRYAQIHLLYDTEPIFYPVIALVLSLLAIFLAWRLVRPAKPGREEEMEMGPGPAANQKHHHPVEDDEQQEGNQPR